MAKVFNEAGKKGPDLFRSVFGFLKHIRTHGLYFTLRRWKQMHEVFIKNVFFD